MTLNWRLVLECSELKSLTHQQAHIMSLSFLYLESKRNLKAFAFLRCLDTIYTTSRQGPTPLPTCPLGKVDSENRCGLVFETTNRGSVGPPYWRVFLCLKRNETHQRSVSVGFLSPRSQQARRHGLAHLKSRGDLIHIAAPDTPSNAAK